ncbi:hypothetical protein ACQY1Q_06690, partial [Tenacibaculum sp. TC6]|uniref:hypothetical protein n=1 Tax=Tenacibaculum sp. TC6 TaxID=3423223 RepID=UPI003D3639F6
MLTDEAIYNASSNNQPLIPSIYFNRLRHSASYVRNDGSFLCYCEGVLTDKAIYNASSNNQPLIPSIY